MTDSMVAMKQMITRLDDDLHEALKRKAKAEGKSLNAFVVETLGGQVDWNRTIEMISMLIDVR